MLEYFYLLVLCFLSIELLLKLKFTSHIYSIMRTTSKVFSVITSSNISDHWKEKIIPAYAFNIFQNSLLILLQFFIIILFVFAFNFLSNSFFLMLISLKGAISSLIFSFSYFKIRQKFIK
jgi:hypothetical protein